MRGVSRADVILIMERALARRQINIGHARINVCVRVPDPLQRVCRCGGTHKAAAKVDAGLTASYAEAPNIHRITLAHKG